VGADAAAWHKLKVVTVPSGTVWHRITHRRHGSALHFGTGPDARWNDPDGRYGVLYLADSVDSAFAETFGHDVPRTIAPLADKFIDTRELEERHIYRVQCRRQLRVGLFHGAGLAALNLDLGLLATLDYRLPQQWSCWVHAAPARPDGITYPSRALPDHVNTALFDRCRGSLTEQDLGTLRRWRCAETGRTIFDILDEQGWGLL
jgi:hypothetical protein